MYLAIQALTFASWQAYATETKETSISKRDIVKNPNWQEADQLDYRETNPVSSRVETLNPGPPDYNTSALNHSTALPPVIENELKMCDSFALKLTCRETKENMVRAFLRFYRINTRGKKMVTHWSIKSRLISLKVCLQIVSNVTVACGRKYSLDLSSTAHESNWIT